MIGSKSIKNGEEFTRDLIIFENTFQITDINDPFSNPKKSTMVNLERLQKFKTQSQKL